jgi:hypothetical protein
MLVSAWCAGIHSILGTSPPVFSNTNCQILAFTCRAAVAAFHPDLAMSRTDLQSVKKSAAPGKCEIAIVKAHASAAGMVLT